MTFTPAAIDPDPSEGSVARVPHEPLLSLFLRFLRFGALAWGGPVAQIAMIRQELVEEERWVTREQFNRALAVYQILPGPEAHELCVYFGMLSRGRIGGILAGLGFMLPGLLLMLVLSWAYVRFGLKTQGIAAVFDAVQVAVAALIVRAVFRIGGHVLVDRWLIAIAVIAALAQMGGAHFALVFAAGGFVYMLGRQHRPIAAMVLVIVCSAALVAWVLLYASDEWGIGLGVKSIASDHAPQSVSALELFSSGLKTGLLTFGGAYTAIPLLQRDAVLAPHAWMTNAQFLDGVALSGLLPAPLIIFATFVGYIGGGLAGALLVTAGVFIPAFGFTLLGHDFFERWLHHPRIRVFLDGVTAAVVGLIAGTTIGLMRESVVTVQAAVLFCIALLVLFRTNARLAIPGVIAGAALWGFVMMK
jgi:chromate transporter